MRRELPQKTIWSFTGFTWEELHDPAAYSRCEVTDELLSLLDVLVDGRYVDALHDISLRFRGSSNQRIIDVPKTLQSGALTLWDERANHLKKYNKSAVSILRQILNISATCI